MCVGWGGGVSTSHTLHTTGSGGGPDTGVVGYMRRRPGRTTDEQLHLGLRSAAGRQSAGARESQRAHATEQTHRRHRTEAVRWK